MGRLSDYIVFDKNNNISIIIIIIILVIKVDHSMCQRLHSQRWLTGHRERKEKGESRRRKESLLIVPTCIILSTFN